MFKRRSIALLISGVLVVMSGGGCVRRKLSVTSQPEGALVTIDGVEAGRTPFETDFTWYGFHEVEVRKEGYAPAIERRRMIAPWWQWPPFDLVAELMPWQPTDRQSMAFELKPRPEIADAELLARGSAMRRETNAGLPATKPSETILKPKPKPHPTTAASQPRLAP
ncbi:MAG: PEGA domain-containing protein [Tepidisphaeraceae bacterium]